MNQIRRNTSLILCIMISFSVFNTNCRVDPNPKGSLFDPGTTGGLINSFVLYDALSGGPSRTWTSFVSPFGTMDPTDSLVFDQLTTTTYAIYIKNTNLTTRLYSSSDGLNYSQVGNQINNTNTNIFGAFTSRFQLSNYNTTDSGVNWNSSTIPGFCLVKYNNTSAYILDGTAVERTIDSGLSTNTLTSSPAYPSRNSGVCSFGNGKAYLLGGKNGSSNLFDFWESTDGINWSLLTERVKPTSGGGFNLPCNVIQNANDTSILGLVYSDVTTYKFHIIFSNLALLQSNDGQTWQCTNPNLNYNSEFNSIANRAVLIGNRLFVYGISSSGPQNVYTDL
ncbi:conserved hypothetical protein [Leptospira biflexa serovar Patoc strain 'Patoc 1 (Ames)']|uniref:Exo-alpha-sialidase n=1 Tax=Leptospira biflexa serovar Patoc (strain Patoc 1 / ATCC 23582 / Paris) TaxID=456481 RepID=B0SSZ2_LEPBP|nr:hypothetical protein [Leptospira biflexa]ABZ94574.1 conserved hypothetical protein [Leptospira biflexa serovar Patoc strain 'Patoc 1 (Ames)']ABZ98232.1 Hypothetical protein; putative signal peptide [Leptospira biflexa serovar Patoc strain 'Patoc 1 (Paris)']